MGDAPNLVGGPDHGAPKGLQVVPANSTLQVTDPNNLPTEQLTAQVVYSDGSAAPTSASWTVDRYDVASVGAGSGVVQPTGAVFGKVNVAAAAMGFTATTSVTVSMKATVNASGISPGDASLLAGATAPDPAVQSIAYPYDGTVFPTGLVAPEIMWNLGSAGDEYLVRFTTTGFELSVLTTADPPSRFTLQQSLWNALVETAAGGDVTVQLRRLSAGSAYVSASESWHVAAADLRGVVYYWAVGQGQVMRADPTIGKASEVFAPGSNQLLGSPPPLDAGSPYSPPWEDNGAGDRCVACHSVSKNGSTLAAVFSTGGSEGPLGFVNLQSASVSAIGDYAAKGMFTAIVPDGALAVMNTVDERMHLVDTATGLTVASALDALPTVADPAFSPDGTLFALAGQVAGGTGLVLEFAYSNLSVWAFDEATRTFSLARTVLSSGAAGSAIAFPSFSPDSKWIVFQGGDYSRAKYGTSANKYAHGRDDLYVVPVQPNATPIALDEANGAGVLPADGLHLNYAPTVSPIAQGGYFWVVFTSPRDYGNRMVSPEQPPPGDATYSNHKQLWVAAIDASVGTTDPSHPAFWLPGQAAASTNMFGYWTLAPCKPTEGDAGPETCAAGFECCSGFCRDTDAGSVCVANPGGCHQLGEACAATSDCCNAGPMVECAAGICQTIGTQ